MIAKGSDISDPRSGSWHPVLQGDSGRTTPVSILFRGVPVCITTAKSEILDHIDRKHLEVLPRDGAINLRKIIVLPLGGKPSDILGARD